LFQIRSPHPLKTIAEDQNPLEELPEEEAEKQHRKPAAAASALTQRSHLVGDRPFVNMRTSVNILFVCKLNPVSQDEYLMFSFSCFGPIMFRQVIGGKGTAVP
jgi:peptidyl-prolyl cis-trans isomerase-like 4